MGGSWFWKIASPIFLIASSVLLYVFLLGPALSINRAKSWNETACKIISSELKAGSVNAKGGRTYSIEIAYEYVVDGKTYQTNRYDFFSISSNTDVDRKRTVVETLKAGTEAKCFVNPSNPKDAVISRDWTNEMWWGLIAVPFLIVGVVGGVSALRKSS